MIKHDDARACCRSPRHENQLDFEFGCGDFTGVRGESTVAGVYRYAMECDGGDDGTLFERALYLCLSVLDNRFEHVRKVHRLIVLCDVNSLPTKLALGFNFYLVNGMAFSRMGITHDSFAFFRFVIYLPWMRCSGPALTRKTIIVNARKVWFACVGWQRGAQNANSLPFGYLMEIFFLVTLSSPWLVVKQLAARTQLMTIAATEVIEEKFFFAPNDESSSS